MTGAPGPAVVPDPLRPPRGLRPPQAAWPARILFFALGLVVTVSSVSAGALYGVSAYYARPREPEWPASVIMFLPPMIALAFVVTMRVRRGTRWRWLSFLAGCIAGPAVLGAVARMTLT